MWDDLFLFMFNNFWYRIAEKFGVGVGEVWQIYSFQAFGKESLVNQ